METLTRNLFLTVSCKKKKNPACMVVHWTRTWTYLNNVEDDILVETVQNTLGYTIVVPGSMDEQQILQVFELCGREVRGGKHDDKWIISSLSKSSSPSNGSAQRSVQCRNTGAIPATFGLNKAAVLLFPSRDSVTRKHSKYFRSKITWHRSEFLKIENFT